MKNIRQAAITLDEELRQYSWLRFVGIGEEDGQDVFIVYVNKRNLKSIIPFVPKTWEGVPVIVRFIQQPVPIQQPMSAYCSYTT